MAGLEASRLHTSTSSVATSYASSSRVTVLSAAESSVRHSPAQPKISSQLGGAWLEVLDGDVQDELQKEKLQLAKAEAAAEAKKSVDVLWYDQVRVL
jgi:Ulp1 family protease